MARIHAIRGRSPLKPSISAAVVAILLAAQALLPLLQVWHEATEHGHAATVATTSTSQHAPPAHPGDKHDDESSCPTCQTFILARQAFFVPESPVIDLMLVVHETPIGDPGLIVIDGSGLSERSARGPPLA